MEKARQEVQNVMNVRSRDKLFRFIMRLERYRNWFVHIYQVFRFMLQSREAWQQVHSHKMFRFILQYGGPWKQFNSHLSSV